LYRRQGLKRLLEGICPGRVKQGEPLNLYTTLRIGGKADWLIEPKSNSEVEQLLETADGEGVPWFVLGRGSNLLVSDQGVRGMVFHLASPRLPKVLKQFKNGRVLIEVEAGFSLPGLVRFGTLNGLKGLEFLAGIPGSIGGAWAMNAGSSGKEIKDITSWLTIISPLRPVVRKGKKQLPFGYRALKLDPGEVILSGGILLSPGDKAGIQTETRRLWSQRRTAQPLNRPSCGSVFKNPPGDYAGRLIEQVGLKGTKKGEAQISTKHANFIVNRGEAKARDVLYLMNLIRIRVRDQFGILLEPEVHLWGCRLKDI
jgi:UDP-N-acetylmuramate dehydrogenase